MTHTARLTTALGDRYQIERELGSGGMATVYLAKDLKHDREVALKVLRPELGAVLGGDRFLAEIKITARLDHPHILTLIDSGAADGFLYYVLPYVRGESLRHKLEREKQLGIDEALSITRQIASALDYAHQHGVVHRDIKPENILLHEGEAVLADFGIALAVKEAGGNRLTETGLSLGTPQYMSPEQATGDRTLDARSDVYSLAAVLYEMLAGEPPVTGATAQAMIAKLMTERPSRIRVVRDTVPEGIDNAVAKALAKVPADRFAHAGDFSAALQQSARPSAPARAAGSRRPLALRVGLGVVVVGAVAALLIKGSGGGVRIIQPDRVQITFTGNARTPALSPDGQRLAYTTRQCTPDGFCTVDIVVQDIGGAGATVVQRDWASVWEIDWTSDGRYLLVNGFQGQSGTWGPFSVPSLGGGTARFLGCCGATLGAGDTALVTRSTGGDSLFWVRFVTMSDGIAHDSMSSPRVAGMFLSVWPLGSNRRFLFMRRGQGTKTARIVDRDGTARDSMNVTEPRAEIDGPSVDGHAILVSAVAGQADERNLVAYAISDAGKIAARGDTILHNLRGGWSLARNGAMVNASGPRTYEVWAMQRASAASMRFTQRRLAASTAPLGGSLSLDGRVVMLWRRVIEGGRSLTQVSTMAFDSGPETPVGPPRDYVDYDWSSVASAMAVAVRRGDSVDVGLMTIPGGRLQPVMTGARRDVSQVWGLPNGGVIVTDESGLVLHLAGAPWRRDTVLTFSESDGTAETVGTSPDGPEIVVMGWDRTFDSVVVRRVSLVDGRATRLAVFFADGSHTPLWLPDNTIIAPIRETGTTIVWYRVPAGGGRPVRLGTPPRSVDATLRLSADGKRALSRLAGEQPDVFLIRNFAELLRH